jgi:FkbM family methyltransferase
MKSETVIKKIGSRELEMDSSHLLPQYLEQYKLYDRALPYIGKILKDIDGYLTVIDIGANIGDTVALMSEKASGKYLCVEGDPKFLPFLKNNIKKIMESEIEISENYCSDEDSESEQLQVESQNGTAKLVTSKDKTGVKIQLKRLDTIIKENPTFEKSNLLKIDTDGFEINILKGAFGFLKKAKPAVHIEFTPDFYKSLNQDPIELINVLVKLGYRKALFFDNFGLPTEIINLSDLEKVKALISKIDYSSIYYFDILTIHHDKELKYTNFLEKVLLSILDEYKIITTDFKNRNVELEKSIGELNKKKKVLNDKLLSKTKELDKTKQDLLSTQALSTSLYLQLQQIETSKAWKLILLIRKIILKIFPKNSFHRKLIGKTVTLLKSIPTYFEILIRKVTPKKKISVNLDSKKIVYVGHSYHNQTKSTVFLQEYLMENFEMTKIDDDSWNGSPKPDLSFIDETYRGVVFFQLLPSPEELKQIKNQNIVFIPMYDGYANAPYSFWKQYGDLKILNFSKTLHIRLKKWGFNSMFIQRWPEPAKSFKKGNENAIFLYTRNAIININVCKQLLGDKKVKMHIHKTIDPGQEYLAPTKEDEKKYKITYSEWFEKKEDKWKLAEKSALFLCPRPTEGIGQGEIEGLAIGRAIISVDAPTINEYIVHNVNGYLYDLNDPKPIDFSNVREVQKNAYQSCVDGYNKWLIEKPNILTFINSTK